MKRIALLGATGSIGDSTLDVVRAHPDRFSIACLCGGRNVGKLAAAIREFRPACAAIADEARRDELAGLVRDTGCAVLGGTEGVLECVRRSEANLCVSAIVGSAGLRPTLEAINLGIDIALANKETLVAAGAIVTRRVRDKNVRLLPVDSEHAAALQCMNCGARSEVERLILTASGGPFFGKKLPELEKITPREALAHPTWNMGPKITVDSASLANKALEVIEAHWLFDLPYDRIDVLVHRQSLVHALVQYRDGSMLAQLAAPDMRLPIQYALNYPERLPMNLPRLGVKELGQMTFALPDPESFPMLDLGYAAGQEGGLMPAVYSAANEEAVALFLTERIGFTEIPRAVEAAMRQAPAVKDPSLDDIFEAEAQARASLLRRYA